MKNIRYIFRNDMRRISASVVAIVIILGLAAVPCLYAWFNIFSNWDPYGPDATSRIKVAVASEDAGASVLGLKMNIGDQVISALEANDTIGWQFVDKKQEALDLVYSGDCYAALIIPENFTGNVTSFLSGDITNPELIFYQNDKKNAIAPKITAIEAAVRPMRIRRSGAGQCDLRADDIRRYRLAYLRCQRKRRHRREPSEGPERGYKRSEP